MNVCKLRHMEKELTEKISLKELKDDLSLVVPHKEAIQFFFRQRVAIREGNK